MKVIIVEDDKVLALLLSKMIARLGYQVLDIFSKGREAVQQIPSLNADVILMDIMLEDDVDGIDVMLNLRSSGLDTNVIYITGNSDSANKNRAEETNYLDYLIKPVGFDELKDTLASINV